MSLKPLILAVSITLGLLAVTVAIRFIFYPLYCSFKQMRLKRKVSLANQEKIIEIKISRAETINEGGIV